MKRSRFTEEQIAYALRQAEAGTPVADVCRQLGVSEATFYVWKKKYGKLPSFYGAQSYDGILLIDSAVKAVKGNLKDQKGMIAAMRKANFNSTRGKFTYNQNHVPIQNFYLLKAVAGPTPSSDPVMEIQKTVFANHKDAYSQNCKMKW